MIKFLRYINPYKKLWKLFFINLIIALAVLLLFWKNALSSVQEFSITLIWAYTISFTQWMGHVYINNKLTERYSWTDEPIKRTFSGIFFVIGYGVLAYLIVQFVMMQLVYGYLPDNPWQWALHSSIYVIIISFGVTLLFTAIGFFKAWKKSLLDAEQIKIQMLAYKYEALQNQINPHFLFNSFNVLSDLVYENQKKAIQFIKQMSQLFRYVLDNRDKELVPIKEELNFIKSYIFLLQNRFENKLIVNLKIEVIEEEMIVPMAMQVLVENCVKHNEVSSEKPLTIDITRNDEFFEVINNYQPKNIDYSSKKTGLNNIKQQYSFFTDKKLIIHTTADYYSVMIPILKTIEE